MLHMFETPSPRVRAKGDGVERPTDDIAQALAALFEVGTSPIVLLDLSTGRIERVNARFCELLNYDLATLPSLRLNDVLHLGDRAATKFNFLQSMRTTGSWEGELRHIRADGAAVWLSAGVTVWRRDAYGEPTHAIAVLQNVTERRAVLELMRVSEEMLRTGQQVGRIATLSREGDDDRLRFGPMSSAMFGLPDNDDAIPMGDFMKLVHPEDAAELNRRSVEAVARRDVEFSAEFRIVRPSDGLERHIEVRVRYNYDENGVLLGSIGVGIDVTERKEAEQLLELAAWHDALTGLPNRTYFRARLDEACARATSAEPIAVLCLDLDRFKDVNDTLGHPVGDKLLVQVGLRLQAQMRVGDTVARLGGDEFAVIQIGLHEREDAGRLARRLIEKLREPYFIEGDRVTVGASVGVAVSPRDGLRGDHLMKSADLALYEAKAQPNRGWRFFEPRMNALAQARYELDADLRLAIQEKQFEVVYQPMLDAGSLRVQNFEALVRWRHPTKGLIPPDLFIPACEQNGMICQIGEWVLRRACAEAAGWPGGIGVAVNVSAVQVTDGELDVSVAAALSASGLAPDRLELEITETALLQDTAATYATIQRIKAMGVRIALDDFGVGHASLDYLQCFPFDKVKIDRSFTREVDRSQRGAAVLRAMLDLCAAFGLPTVVEGVETQAQLNALELRAGTRVQGHLFSPARPADCVLELIERFSGAAALAKAAA